MKIILIKFSLILSLKEKSKSSIIWLEAINFIFSPLEVKKSISSFRSVWACSAGEFSNLILTLLFCLLCLVKYCLNLSFLLIYALKLERVGLILWLSFNIDKE